MRRCVDFDIVVSIRFKFSECRRQRSNVVPTMPLLFAKFPLSPKFIRNQNHLFLSHAGVDNGHVYNRRWCVNYFEHGIVVCENIISIFDVGFGFRIHFRFSILIRRLLIICYFCTDIRDATDQRACQRVRIARGNNECVVLR